MAKEIPIIWKENWNGYPKGTIGTKYRLKSYDDWIIKINDKRIGSVYYANFARTLTQKELIAMSLKNFLVINGSVTKGFDTISSRDHYIQTQLQKTPSIVFQLYELQGEAKAKPVPVEFTVHVGAKRTPVRKTTKKPLLAIPKSPSEKR